jgi:XTP/dITP diphosphohydrolase
MKILFATTNLGKLKEAKKILNDQSLVVLSLSHFPELSKHEVVENGKTFKDNALLKAQQYGELSHFLTLAEDAGLEVDALGGKPGVMSARFGPTDQARNDKLLTMLANQKNRQARFISLMCLYDPSSKAHYFFEGKVEGKISLKAKGDAGFGYDPLFIPNNYEQTFAQLSPSEKNKISHRKKSLKKVAQFLKDHYAKSISGSK